MNGCLWALGLEEKITPDLNIAFVGAAKPNTFGGGAYARGIKPEMYAGFESPIPANNNTKAPDAKPEPKKDAPKGDKAAKKDAAAKSVAQALAAAKATVLRYLG